jgi:hypothetical protein
MTTPATPDFVELQLTAAGVAFAGEGGIVRMNNGHYSYTFTASQPVRVLSSEWRRGFPVKTFDGQPILQIAKPSPAPVSASSSSAAPAAKAKTRSSRFISPAASHTDAPAQPVSQATQPAAAASVAEAEVK